MFSQARVQSLLSWVYNSSLSWQGALCLLEGWWDVLRGSGEFSYGPFPLSQDEATALHVEAPPLSVMWSPDWQLSLRSWWESLSSSWNGACPLSHAAKAPCTYKLWRRGEEERRRKGRGGEETSGHRGEWLRKRTTENRLKRWMCRQRQGQVWGWRDNYTKLERKGGLG